MGWGKCFMVKEWGRVGELSLKILYFHVSLSNQICENKITFPF